MVRLLVAALAGVALAATCAPWEQRWLLPTAVAAWAVTLHRANWRAALLLGYVFGSAYLLTLTFWMRVVGIDAWLLIGLAVAGYYAILGMGIALVIKVPGWPVWAASMWVVVEAAMSAWPLGGFPWSRLAWTAADTPLTVWLPWVGASGVSLLAALLGLTLAWLIIEIRRKPAATLTTTLALLVLLSVPLLVRPASLKPDWTTGRPTVRVAAVQGNVPGEGDDLVAHHRQVTRNHVEATVELGRRVAAGQTERPDFVIWPENATAVDPFSDAETNRGIEAAVAAVRVPVLIGAIVDGARPDEVLNQGITWWPGSGPGDRYTKRHPVPFGEYIPLRRWLTGLQIGRLKLIPRDMAPGSRTRPLNVNGTQVADIICFDIAFDDAITSQVKAGAQLVAVQTSNAMFINTSQLEQQFAISRLRAMETGRTVVVAATNGISGVIGPDGAVHQAATPRTTAVVVADVPTDDRPTPALIVGDRIERLALVGLLTATAFAGTAAIRRRADARTSRIGNGVRVPREPS